MNLIFTKETDSTNNLLRKLIAEKDLPEFTVLQTDFQTAGKGQSGNKWQSERGKNLLCSILLKPENILAAEQFIISQMTGNAIKNTLNKFADGFSVKWPNDIYLNDQKICGILIENDLTGNKIKNSIIGIGLNINQIQFPEKLPNPVSLKTVTGKSLLRKKIMENIVQNLKRQYLPQNFTGIRAEYFENLYRRNEFFNYQSNNKIFRAKIIAVKNDGKLILATAEGEKKEFYFKEVKFMM
jgi:BirA family biotin operon repressor/biotin-[acetyl-CoA-carboxylase] ligase